MPLPAQPSDEHLRALAAEVLARPEYARWRTGKTELSGWLLESFGRFLEWMARLAAESPWLYALVLCALIALTLLLLGHVIWSIRAAITASSPRAVEAAQPAGRNFASEAHALAQQGRFLEAAHRLQLASIQALLEKGVIELARHEPNRTLRERIAVSRLPASLQTDLIRCLDQLEVRWFRERDSGRDLYDAWVAMQARLARGAM